MSPQAHEMATLASRFCELIEASSEEDLAWLRGVAQLLPRLHAAITTLDGDDGSGESLMADLDARFELYTHLRTLLGDKDSYWMEYDSANDGHAMSGSLADDLTDIYCELKYGLMLLQDEPEREADAYASWQEGYRVHWGQHLIDAERHLYDLESRNKLELQ